MTRIILHGGYPGYWEQAGTDLPLFTRLIEAARKADNKILISFLAQETPQNFPHLDLLLATFKNMSPDTKITVAGRDTFTKELPQHRVLFMQGGNSQAQNAVIKDIDASQIKDNKDLIVGSSSGGMALCRYGYSNSGEDVLKGTGIVHANFIPHANAWPIDDYIPHIRNVCEAPIHLVDELAMHELKI